MKEVIITDTSLNHLNEIKQIENQGIARIEAETKRRLRFVATMIAAQSNIKLGEKWPFRFDAEKAILQIADSPKPDGEGWIF